MPKTLHCNDTCVYFNLAVKEMKFTFAIYKILININDR